ncbi:MAG: YtpR family tRNA-binding protein, partial [Bacilli bacterium]
KEGLKVVVALPGCVLHDGTWILEGQLLGVASQGMLCSARELGLEQTKPGILELDDSYKIGQVYK